MNKIQEIIKENVTLDANGCWIWGGYVRGGYPCVSIKKNLVPVHRLSYEMWNGDIPDNLIVRHKCDVPRCVNPEHLETGTHKDNTQDMIKRGRGRYRCGPSNGFSKLTDNERQRVVDLARRNHTHQQIADIFDISRENVSRICRRAGISNTPRKLSEAQKEEIIKLRSAGAPREEIANQMNVATSTVGYYLWKHNKSK